MSAATMDAPTEDRVLVSQPESSALFMAPRADLRLVKKSIRAVRGPEGEVLDQTLGETIAFKDGVLRVPTDPDAPFTLTNGETMPAGEVLAWLDKHRLNGNMHEGFWRVDPTAPPPSKQELDTLQSLAIELDADGLREFIAQEEAAWNREELLEIARGTLTRIDAKLEQLQAAHAEQLAAARAEGEQAARSTKPAAKAADSKGA